LPGIVGVLDIASGESFHFVWSVAAEEVGPLVVGESAPLLVGNVIPASRIIPVAIAPVPTAQTVVEFALE
jgi:hypothetical protein